MSQSSFDVVISVPRVGRVSHNFLRLLESLGAPPEEINILTKICGDSKANSSQDFEKASQYLKYAMSLLPCFGLFIDKKREARPFRVGLLSYQTRIGDLNIKIEGDEPHNSSSLLRFNETDLAVVGYDELLIITQAMLDKPKARTKWGMYNSGINERSTKIVGSAGLSIFNSTLKDYVQDFVGFFLISRKPSKLVRDAEAEQAAAAGGTVAGAAADAGDTSYPVDFLRTYEKSRQPIFVKARYLGIVSIAYPNLNLSPVEDVEDAVLASNENQVGLEIIQSGNTTVKKGLYVHGAPLFQSESLFVANYDRYLNNPKLKQFLELLAPQGYFSDERTDHFARWYRSLELNLGKRWLSPPPLAKMFCEHTDIHHGLRPYRLQTRDWMPSDDYKRPEALAAIGAARDRLESAYQALLPNKASIETEN